MAVYVVTWNLNREAANYANKRTQLLALIAGYEHTFDAGLETVRWISTNADARTLGDHLTSVLDNNDRLYVSRVHRNEYWGILSDQVWRWIDQRV